MLTRKMKRETAARPRLWRGIPREDPVDEDDVEVGEQHGSGSPDKACGRICQMPSCFRFEFLVEHDASGNVTAGQMVTI